jgi:hypothetical protein
MVLNEKATFHEEKKAAARYQQCPSNEVAIANGQGPLQRIVPPNPDRGSAMDYKAR